MSNMVVGVYARDEIPYKINRAFYGFVSNTDKSNQEGGHWVAYFVTSKTTGFFFDSYGNPPAFYSKDFEQFFTSHKLTFDYNRTRLQGYNSNVCGQYVCLYLLYQSRKVSLEHILNLFTENSRSNDISVHDLMESTFPCCFSHNHTGQ